LVGILHILQTNPSSAYSILQIVTNLGFAICINWIHDKIEKGKIPLKVFQPSPKDHEKHSEDPQCPHKVHIVNRIKSGKDAVKILGLEKKLLVSNPTSVLCSWANCV
uniref:Uncharacterized protein n=1 Tax=Oryctolagus cuniculus TaxID=9986 RepID=A0A5F9CKK2_RABIT